MPIDDLIDRLSADPRVRSKARPTTRVVLLSALSGSVVAGLSFGLLGQADSLAGTGAAHDHGFFLNFVFMMSVAACALAIVRDLSVPARPACLHRGVLSIPFALIMLLGVHEVAGSSLHEISQEADKVLWASCFLQIFVLSVPAFAVLMAGVKQLAPTDLRRTGAYIGMLSGALGAMGHCWHVPTDPFYFGAFLYIAAVGAMMLVGYLVGPRILRWA